MAGFCPYVLRQLVAAQAAGSEVVTERLIAKLKLARITMATDPGAKARQQHAPDLRSRSGGRSPPGQPGVLALAERIIRASQARASSRWGVAGGIEGAARVVAGGTARR